MTLNYSQSTQKNKMINYDSDGDRILSSSNTQEDNIDRIQAKMQGVSIGEFANFVDFVNNEFKTIYGQLDDLNAKRVEFETMYRQELLSIVKAHNLLITTLIDRQFNSRVTNQQYVDNLRDSLLDEKDDVDKSDTAWLSDDWLA